MHLLWRAISLPAGLLLALTFHVMARLSAFVAVGPGAAYEGPAVHVNWHRDLPAVIVHHGARRRWMLMSAAPKMGPIAVWSRAMGLSLVRGASGERGREALPALAALLRGGESVVLAVDGPAGPPFVAKRGAFDLASAAQVPVIPIVIRGPHATVPGRWDRLRLFLPFGRVEVRCGPPFRPSAPADVQAALDSLDRTP